MVITSIRFEGEISLWSEQLSSTRTHPWNQLERGNQCGRVRRSGSSVVYRFFLLPRTSARISGGYVRRWSMGDIRVSCVDQRMVSVRKRHPVYRASNALAHGVVSSVFEYHDTKATAKGKGRLECERTGKHLRPCLFLVNEDQDLSDDLKQFEAK